MISIDESFLQTLGVQRIPTPVPFMEAGGPANVYAIDDLGGGYTLFDCGCGTEEGLSALRLALSERGLKGLNRIIVSHGHVDHYGNAQTLSEETDAKIFIHPHDLEKICGEGRWFRLLEEHRSFFSRIGVPGPVLDELIERSKRNPVYARQVERHRVETLQGKTRLQFKFFDAEVMHMPGHTPGLVCLHDEKHRVLFADDHVLAKISPNPLIDFTFGEGESKFKALVAYSQSAQVVKNLSLDAILPGHGEAFSGHQELLTSLFEFYAVRQQRLLKRLAQGPASVYELLPAVFPRVDTGRLYLMLSEVLANLEVLESRGDVSREVRDGKELYQVAPR